jgi:Mrp family chromosome partitioning ATPase
MSTSPLKSTQLGVQIGAQTIQGIVPLSPTAMVPPPSSSMEVAGNVPPPYVTNLTVQVTKHSIADQKPDSRLVLHTDPDSPRAAAFRVLRHHLLERGSPQVIIVSSAGEGDGKTITALNLALALSECQRAKVLLLETHLRRPALAKALRIADGWCFADQLTKHRDAPGTPWTFLDVTELGIHVGAVNPKVDRTQLLDGPAFAGAMQQLRQAGYDHIVIDAPPVLGSADVNLMAEAADAVLLAIRARRTTGRDLRRAIDQLGAAKVAGTVLVEP